MPQLLPDRDARVFHHLREFAIDDQHLALGVIERESQDGGIEPGVDRIEHRARHGDAVVRFQHRRYIGQHDSNRIAALDAAELGLLGRDLSLADGMRGRMLAAVGRAERRNWSSALLAKQFLERAATVGALPSDAEVRFSPPDSRRHQLNLGCSEVSFMSGVC